MPELPEVEASRRMLLEYCKGASVLSATAAEDTIVIVDCTSREVESTLIGSTIVELHRKGKHLWWELGGGKCVLFHFGMTGSFVVRGKASTKYKSFSVDNEQWPPRFHKLLVTLSTGVEVAFVDSRRFARIRMSSDPLSVTPIKDLGPDPILTPQTTEQWAAALRKRTGAIKGVLLDQSIACGVGNWVADEILFQARIHPETPTSALSADEVESIRKAMLDVCNLAVSVDADDARFPKDWLYHTRWHKVGGKVLGHPVSYITVNGRTSAFVPALQKKKGGSAGASGSKGRKRGPPEEAAGEDSAPDAAPAAGRKKPAAAKKARKTKAEVKAEVKAEGADGAGGEAAGEEKKAAGKRGRGGGKGGAKAATTAADVAEAPEAAPAAAAPAAKKGKGASGAPSAGGGRKRKEPAAPAAAKAAGEASAKPRRTTRASGGAAQ